MTNDELQSKTIAFLRFPLIVGVVLIHSHIKEVVVNGVNLMAGADFPIYTEVSNMLSDVFARIAVPLFFFISGFLFFYKSTFTLSVYRDKLKKRARTILFPYLFWNLVVIVFFFLGQTLIPFLFSGDNRLIVDYTWTDWLNAFWARDSTDGEIGSPIAYQLWFIRDLMVVMIFSPFVYGLVRYLRQYVIILLGVLWIMNWWFRLPGFSSTAFFFFSAGAFFSIHQRNFVADMRPLLLPSAILYGIIAVCNLYFINEVWCCYIHSIGIIVGCIFLISCTAVCLDKGYWRVSVFLAGSSFFVYAYHGIPLALLIKVVIRFFPPATEWAIVSLYLGSALLIIWLGVALYGLLRKCVPSFLSLITGGR